MLVVIDTGMANVGSVSNMIRYLGFESVVSNEKSIISTAEKLILPGVGSFDEGMLALEKYGLIELLHRKVLIDKIPILGICLGMQLMTLGSEEGVIPGLGWFNAQTKKFAPVLNGEKRLVPHMGWNEIFPLKHSSLFDTSSGYSKFYFVHSYFVHANEPSEVLCTTRYGEEFVSGLNRENIFGVQFHPEKSHKYGMHLLRTFIQM